EVFGGVKKVLDLTTRGMFTKVGTDRTIDKQKRHSRRNHQRGEWDEHPKSARVLRHAMNLLNFVEMVEGGFATVENVEFRWMAPRKMHAEKKVTSL
ncbi:MAG: hypothetical protein KDA69_20545, partial [Planctomycetaceae bacterium]|nr:hypothetical protein [Planctomycetaceae bacterium]